MATKIALDRFTQQKQTISGTFKPEELPRLKPFLRGEGADAGEISYTLAGLETADVTGRRTRRDKCIILGWFLLNDPANLEPERYEFANKGNPGLDRSEWPLPPLEDQSE